MKMKITSRVVLALIVCAWTLSASGKSRCEESQFQQHDFFEQTSSGEMVGCGHEFTIFFKDPDKNANSVSAVGGAITYYSPEPMHFLAIIKIKWLYYENGINGNSFDLPINDALFRVGKDLVRFTRFTCQDGFNGYCGSLGGDQAAMLTWSTERFPSYLLFNSAAGLFDHELPFKEEASPAQDVAQFYEKSAAHSKCVLTLAQRSAGKHNN